MLIKLFLSLIIISGCTLVGISYGEKLKKRVSEITQIQQSIYIIKNEIVYTYTPLPSIFKKISDKIEKPIANIYLDIWEKLTRNEVESIYTAFRQHFIEHNKEYSIKEQDIEIILELAKSLGESDVDGQKSIIELSLLKIKKNLEEANEDMKKNLKLYRTLGFAFGAAIVIIIV